MLKKYLLRLRGMKHCQERREIILSLLNKLFHLKEGVVVVDTNLITGLEVKTIWSAGGLDAETSLRARQTRSVREVVCAPLV